MRAYQALWPEPMTHEELGIALLRDEYLGDRCTVEEFEEKIGLLLDGDFGVVPMGGMPLPDTGRREVR